MVFGITKSKQPDKFELKDLSAAAATRHSAGLTIWQKSALAALTGILLAFSSPGLDQWWLAWFMVAPFLVLLAKCRTDSESLLCGLFFGLGYHLLTLRFYAGAHCRPIGQLQSGHEYGFFLEQLPLLIWLVQAILLSLPAVAFAWLVNVLPLRPGYIPYLQRPFFPYLISVPLLWIFLHHGLAIARPLADIWQLSPLPPITIDALAYSQYNQLAIIQSAKFIGSFGLEFLLLLVNAAIASFLLELVEVQDRPVERVDLISPRLGAVMDLTIAAGLIGALSSYGLSAIMHQTLSANETNIISSIDEYLKSEDNQPKIPVGVLCGNISDTESTSASQTLADTAGSFEMVVLPESNQIVNPVQSNNVLDLVRKTVRRNDNAALWSFVLRKRENCVRQDIVSLPVGNFRTETAVLFAKNYPFLPVDSLPATLQEWFQGASTIAKINWGKIAILGGSEITNSRVVANQVRSGASLIVCETNIDWMGDKCLGKQLLAAAVLRAVENNRYVVLSGGNFVSAIIAPNGLIHSLFLAPSVLSQPNNAEKSGMIFSLVQFLWSKTSFTNMWWL